MRKIKVITKELEKVVDIICNMCGESCFSEINYNGLIETSVVGSYDSKVIDDLMCYTFSICEICLKAHVFDKCKVPPEVKKIGV